MFAWLVHSSGRPEARLSDGERLTLLRVTVGPKSMFYPRGLLDRISLRLGLTNEFKLGTWRFAPSQPLPGQTHLQVSGWHFDYTNEATAWIGHSGSPKLSPGSGWMTAASGGPRATLADESGEEWEMWLGPSTVNKELAPGFNYISKWRFVSFPRRGKVLRFRIYALDDTGSWNKLTDFKISNPFPSPYPVWQSESLPVIRRTNQLEVSLVGMEHGGLNLRSPVPGDEFINIHLSVRHRDQPTVDWMPDSVEAEDATGNQMVTWTVKSLRTNGLIQTIISESGFNPNEVWRLRLHLHFETSAREMGEPSTTMSPQAVRSDPSDGWFEFMVRPPRGPEKPWNHKKAESN